MAFHQILSNAELQIAPEGLYCVAGNDGSAIEETRSTYDAVKDEWTNDVPSRLMARVRADADVPVPNGIEGVTARADGKCVVTAWVPIALIESAESIKSEPESAAEVAEVPNVEAIKCPLCSTPLTNRVIRTVTVCPGCGKSIALVDGNAIRATATQTLQLSPAEVKLLKKDRPK